MSLRNREREVQNENSGAHINEVPPAVRGLGRRASAAASDIGKVADSSGNSLRQASRPVRPVAVSQPAAAQPINDRQNIVPAVSRPRREIVPPRRFTNLVFTRSDIISPGREAGYDRPVGSVGRPAAPRAAKNKTIAISCRHYYVKPQAEFWKRK